MLRALTAQLDAMTASVERATQALRHHNDTSVRPRPAGSSARPTATLDQDIRRGRASATLGTLRRRVPAPRR